MADSRIKDRTPANKNRGRYLAPMRRTLFLLTLAALLSAGCAISPAVNPLERDHPYGRKIRDWQERIQREGWSGHAVRSLLADFRDLARYRMELADHWATPREFIASGMEGDCEDIAAFLLGTLRRLGYPLRARILVVKGWFGHHALLRVELPDGRWSLFETIPGRRIEIHSDTFEPVAEFDEAFVRLF